MSGTVQDQVNMTRLTLIPNEHKALLNFEADISFTANGRLAMITVKGTMGKREDMTLARIQQNVLDVIRTAIGPDRIPAS